MVSRMLNDAEVAVRWDTTRATVSRMRQRGFLPEPRHQDGRAQWSAKVIEYFEKNGFTTDPKAFRKRMHDDTAVVAAFSEESKAALEYAKGNAAPPHAVRFLESVNDILVDVRLPVGYQAEACRILRNHMASLYGRAGDPARLDAATDMLRREHAAMLGQDDKP